MSPRFEAWRADLARLTEGEAEFQKWLFVRSAGVLFGGKGGELLVLGANNCELSIDRQIRCIETLSSIWQYFYVLLVRKTMGCACIAIYDPSRVRKALSKVPGPVFELMGYSLALGPKEFLEEVGRRWRGSREIPHEIGLALGYPVKDVLGFIGLMPLQCTGLCGWRIYGDPEPSLLAKQRYKKAEARAKAFVDNGSARRNAVVNDKSLWRTFPRRCAGRAGVSERRSVETGKISVLAGEFT
jgi:hypothetical protein